MARILVGTEAGLYRFDGVGQEPLEPAIEHAGRQVTAVAPEGWELWTILDGAEVWHTAGIDWWFHVATLEGLHGNCLADTRAGVLVGTSQAGLFRVAGSGLERVVGFDDVEDRPSWYTPWGGPPDTRSISEDREAVYVNVHVGGIARSLDQGKSWAPTIDIHADVHRVTTGGGSVFAATGRGLAVSMDQGATWSFRRDGLHADYCRGVTVCGDSLLLSASTGPSGERSAVYRGRLDGGPFQRGGGGLPDWFSQNIDSPCLDALPGGQLAALATPDWSVFSSSDQGASWTQLASGLPQVHCLLVTA